MKNLVKRNILGISLTNGTINEILEYVIHSVKDGKKKLSIVTPNPEIVVYAAKHPEFRKLINRADIALCDGVGLYLTAKYLGNPLKERISGVDLMQELCREAAEKAVTVGFLGGRGNVAERTAQCLIRQYPGLDVRFSGEERSPLGFTEAEALRGKMRNVTQKDAEDNVSVVSRKVSLSSALPIDILFVAYGAPKQEEWIAHNLPVLPVRVMMGVGGAFDYLSGEVMRAPFFIRAIGLEWLFRLIRQPWRLKRQLQLLTFIKLVLQEKISQ